MREGNKVDSVGVEGVKVSLFADSVILYKRDLKDSINKFLEGLFSS